MEKSYDLCTGRDLRGRLWHTVLPAGVAKTGMYVRLLGGEFLLIDRLERCGSVSSGIRMCTAAQVLNPVWEGRNHG